MSSRSKQRLNTLLAWHSNAAQRIANILAGRRECGCAKGGGRHMPTCLDHGGLSKMSPWNGREMACCGSRSPNRHLNGCALMADDGSLPPDV